MKKAPIDNEEGWVVTLSVMKKGNGLQVQHFLDEKNITSEGQLIDISKKGARLLWEAITKQ